VPYAELVASRPKLPYELVSTHTYKTQRDCGQGPFEIDAAMLGAAYAEKTTLYACVPEGRYIGGRETSDRGEESAFGYTESSVAETNKRCVASVTEVATQGAPTTSTTQPTSNAPSAQTVQAQPSKAQREALDDDKSVTITTEAECPKGTDRTVVTEHGWRSPDATLTAPKGAQLKFELWSRQPLDLRGVTFVVQQFRIDPSTTPGAWASLVKQEEAFNDRIDSYVTSSFTRATAPRSGRLRLPTQRPSLRSRARTPSGSRAITAAPPTAGSGSRAFGASPRKT
jgi:hypothetical protein